jgi:RNAse (barnase) inhibitor barstar
MNYKILTTLKAPYIQEICKKENYFIEHMITINSQNIKDDIFILNGTNMQTWEELFIEFQKVLKFPDYFGHNLDAFCECMGDLFDWLNNKKYILFIKNSEFIFYKEKNTSKNISTLLSILEEIASDWSEDIYISENNGCNRKAYPFHIVLSANIEYTKNSNGNSNK